MKFDFDKIKNKILELKDLIPAGSSKEEPGSNVGLDIGSSSIKLMELINLKEKQVIINAASQGMENFSISQALKQLYTDNKIENKSVNVSISGHGVVTRCIHMPRMPLAEVKNALSFEAEKYIPFAINEVILDCCILEDASSNDNMLVLFAAAKIPSIEKRIQDIKEAGLDLNLIDIDTIALTNCFFNSFSDSEKEEGLDAKSFALLNIGASFCSLNILNNKLPRFMRDIFAGGKDITKRIVNMLGVEQSEAEKIKFNPGEKWDNVNLASESIFSNLANEIRLSFDYYETQGNPQITTLYLSGGGAYLNGSVDFFKENLSVDTVLWNPFANLDISEKIDKKYLESNASKFAIATGLALR